MLFSSGLDRYTHTRMTRAKREVVVAATPSMLQHSQEAADETIGPFADDHRYLIDIELGKGLDYLHARYHYPILAVNVYQGLIMLLQDQRQILALDRYLFSCVNLSTMNHSRPHWIAFCCDTQKKSMFLWDPLPDQTGDGTGLASIAKAFRVAFKPLGYTVYRSCTGIQDDGYNCGPISLSILESLMTTLIRTKEIQLPRDLAGRGDEFRTLWNERLYGDESQPKNKKAKK